MGPTADLSRDFDGFGNSEIWTILLERAYSLSLQQVGFSNIDGGAISDAWKRITGRDATREDVSGNTGEEIRNKILSAGPNKIVALGTEDVLPNVIPPGALLDADDPTKGAVIYEDHTYVVMGSVEINGVTYFQLANPLYSDILVRYDVMDQLIQNLYRLNSTR